MSQRQNKIIEKGEIQTQHKSGSRQSGAYSTSKPKYQWVSSTKVLGRGGESDSTGPHIRSDTQSSVNNNVKKSDGQDGQSSIVPGAISESKAVQNAPFEKSQLSGSSDASTSKTLPKRTLWYRKRDAQIDPEVVSSQSQSKTSTSPLRDGLSSQPFLQIDSSQDFKNGGMTSHSVSERESSLSTSISSKQQTENGNPQLQSKHLKHSKNGTRQQRSKAKKNDLEQPESENLHLQPKFGLEQSKGNMEHFKNETTDLQPEEKSKSGDPYLQPKSKRHIHNQQKLSKPGATAPTLSVSHKQDAKRYVEKFNNKPPRLKAQKELEESKDDRPKVQRQQQSEDVQQCRKETSDSHHEAEREKHNMGISAPTVVTSTQDAVRAVPEAPVATSSLQHSQVFNSLGIHGPSTRTDGMTSTSFQMRVQLSSANPFQVPRPPFVPSLQPYPLQHQGLMHYDNTFNFSPHVGHHLGSLFGINGINSNHAHNILNKPTSRTPVKITHPETKEELILGNSAKKSPVSSSGNIAHYPVVLQPQPVPYGPSLPLNYIPHAQMKSFPFQSPMSVPFRSSQMLLGTSRSGFNSSGVHDETVVTNAGHPSLASHPVLRQAGSSRGENNIHASARSAATDRNQETKLIDPQNVGCELGKANYYLKGSVRKLKSVAVSSPKAGQLVKIASTGINENGITTTGQLYATAKEPQNLSQKYDFKLHKLRQAETSAFVDDPDMKFSEVGECHNNVFAPPKEIEQSDTILEPLPSSGSSIPGSSRLETINLEANHSLVGTSESSLAPSQVGLPPAKVGFPCTSAEVPGQLETGKDLIDAALSLQVDAKTEDLTKQDGTNLVDQPVLYNICKDGSPINLGPLQINQQTKKGSVDMWNSIAERTGDALVDGSVSNSVTTKGASFTGKRNKQEVPCKTGAAGATDTPCRVHKDSDEKLQSSDCRGSGTDMKPTHIFSNSEMEILNEVEAHSNNRLAALDDIQSRGTKRYSRDFLLKLSEQFTEFPEDFKFSHDMAEGLIISHKTNMEHIVDHNSNSTSVPRMDGCGGSSFVHHYSHRKDGHHKWIKSATNIATEPRFGFNGESSIFHPGQGGKQSRNLHGQVHGQCGRGTFTGRASRDGRTRKGAGVEKEFITFQSTFRSMHKAEKKYEVHKVIDGEEAKQRQLKGILNKLTPQNFDRLFQQVKEVNIDNTVTLAGLISQIFDKALMEPTFSEMYANFCLHLASELPDFIEGDEKITFKRLLLNKCQEEFERGEKDQVEADKPDKDGEVRLSEEKRTYARRRMLGNIRLIGELYKKKMLTERIMHECIEKLLRNDQFPEEEDIEALCKLMSTIGNSIDHPRAKEYMDSCFELMLNLSNNIELSTRMRFMLKDVIDLRKNKWQERIKAEGPKKLEELHSDAAEEGRAVGNQLICSPRTFSSNKRASTTYGSQPSNFRSPKKSERATFRAVSSKNHGFESHDMRSDDRKHHHQQGTQSTPYHQDENIKGIPLKEPIMFCSSPVANSHSGIQKSRKEPANQNGYISIPELRPDSNLKLQLTPKYAPNSLIQSPVYSTANQQGYSMNGGSTSANGSSGRSLMTKPTYPSMISSGKGWSDDYFKKISVAAIQEFYRAGNENNVFSYVENLNSPSFNSSMISIWVNDSFQRNEKESDLLAGLLISLTKSRAGGLTTRQLIKGFELVLATPEVALTDAAKAAAFLGKLLGRIVTKNVISLKEIKRMVQQSGKTAGQTPESKLGYEVMKIALETIQLERGESGLKGMCKRFNVQLDDFHPSATTNPTAVLQRVNQKNCIIE